MDVHVEYTIVPDGLYYVVYDATGTRRGAFDSVSDADIWAAHLAKSEG